MTAKIATNEAAQEAAQEAAKEAAKEAAQEAADRRRLLADSALNFVARHAGPKRLRALRDAAADFDPAVWRQMAEQGWLGLMTPEAQGGFGLGLADAAPVVKTLAAALSPEPLVASAFFAGRLIALSDNKPLQGELLAKLCAGDLIPAVAWEESATGLDLAPVRTRAEAKGGAMLLSGSKDFIRPGSGADGFIVSAITDKGLALFWLAKSAKGVKLTTRRLADGLLAAKLDLEQVRLEPGAMLASPAVAETAFQQAYAEALILVSLELQGVMEKALAITLDYLSTRVQFGKPIGSFQALQHRAVDLFIQKELSATAIEEGLKALEDGLTGRALSALASRIKARASDAALLIGREAVQMHGAIGFTDEHDIGLYLKRAMVLSAWQGNSALQRRRFGALTAAANRL